MRSYKWLEAPLHNRCADGVTSRDPCHFPRLSINKMFQPQTHSDSQSSTWGGWGQEGSKEVSDEWEHLRRRFWNQYRRRWWVSGGWVFYSPCISSEALWKQWISLKLHINYGWLLSSLWGGKNWLETCKWNLGNIMEHRSFSCRKDILNKRSFRFPLPASIWFIGL